jgi:N-acetylglutamate synthase-like GNAT family acetyltransferase
MDGNNWRLRKATPNDAKALTVLMHAAYGVYEDRLDGATLPPLTVNYENEIRDFPVWIATDDLTLIAGLILMPEKACMTIANIAVHPQFQGTGVGRTLMVQAETEAKALNLSVLRLATHIDLTGNVEFYTRLGWSETGRDEARIYMQKSIAA